MDAQFKSPAWHGEVLHNRDEKIKSGKESFMNWEAAKKTVAPQTPLIFPKFCVLVSWQ